MLVNQERLLITMRQLLNIDSPTEHEQKISGYLVSELEALDGKVTRDAAGNIIARFAGEGEPILLNAHMDTIQSTAGIQIIESAGHWMTDGKTILGADDKAGLAAILEVIRSLKEQGIHHRSCEVIFTVGEEAMMSGARSLDYSLISAKKGISLDTRGPASNIVTSAPGYVTIEVAITGKAAHAGNAPEKGINAIVVAAGAIANLPWGRLDSETTTNVGVIHGGVACNVVSETVLVTAEVRSLNERKFKAIVDNLVQKFKNSGQKYGASIQIDLRNACRAFKLSADEEIVRIASEAAAGLKMKPTFNATGGVFDASIFNEHGISTIVFGLGHELNHSSSEYLVIADFVQCADLLYVVLKR